MTPVIRRVIYVTTYELGAILLTTVGLAALGFAAAASGTLAVVSSTIAMIWNYLWTTAFEAWEKRQESRTRTLARRIVHSIGFEGGLALWLLPATAWLLKVSLLEALAMEAGLLVFFLIYTFVYAWLFDKVLPPRHTEVEETAQGTTGLGSPPVIRSKSA